jgi:hypothetical protein
MIDWLSAYLPETNHLSSDVIYLFDKLKNKGVLE